MAETKKLLTVNEAALDMLEQYRKHYPDKAELAKVLRQGRISANQRAKVLEGFISESSEIKRHRLPTLKELHLQETSADDLFDIALKQLSLEEVL